LFLVRFAESQVELLFAALFSTSIAAERTRGVDEIRPVLSCVDATWANVALALKPEAVETILVLAEQLGFLHITAPYHSWCELTFVKSSLEEAAAASIVVRAVIDVLRVTQATSAAAAAATAAAGTLRSSLTQAVAAGSSRGTGSTVQHPCGLWEDGVAVFRSATGRPVLRCDITAVANALGEWHRENVGCQHVSAFPSCPITPYTVFFEQVSASPLCSELCFKRMVRAC
jgi:hypothetical protein